jgi:multimeric flavodoxin WrbA
MPKKILILSASPVKNGNTAHLVKWFCQGARSRGAQTEVVDTAALKYKANGCISCRKCQKIKEYLCVIKDEARPVLARMACADVIVMATPLYFYGASAQLKLVMDRMFSLYKWDNKTNTMTTPLAGKTLVLLASAFEDIGLGNLEKPFAITADYSGMKFVSLLVANARESGEIVKVKGARQKAVTLGRKVGS